VNDLALGVEQTTRTEGDFAELPILEKRDFARVLEQRWNIGSDKGFAFTPTDHDGR